MNKYEKYNHHGVEVMVRSDLKGKHRDNCLCFSCTKLNIEDRVKNCPIASELFAFCCKHNTTTPVFECPAFDEKINA